MYLNLSEKLPISTYFFVRYYFIFLLSETLILSVKYCVSLLDVRFKYILQRVVRVIVVRENQCFQYVPMFGENYPSLRVVKFYIPIDAR